MMLCSEKYRSEAQTNWAPGVAGSLMIAPNPDGEPFVGAVTDFFSGGGGARTFTDGLDSGGIFHSMASRLANAETLESRVPVLQVWRRELQDSGGPGRFRGGVTMEFASLPHKLPVTPTGLNNIASGVSVPSGRGLSGGLPGAAARNVILRASDVRGQFAAGRIPVSEEEVGADEVEVLAAKSFTFMGEDDLLIGVISSGSGYGDPLRREPELVARDVRGGLVSEQVARSVYGVVVRDGTVDERETEAQRERIRQERRSGARAGERTAGGIVDAGRVLHPVSDTVEAVEADGQRSLRCSLCHYRFGDYEQDHKRAALVRELPLTAVSPHNRLCLPEYVLREFYCPGCATLLAADVQHRDEPILDESQLAAPGADSGER
jgi:N-methylhydantoinase B